MQTWEAIESRRNVRSFADRPIPAADVDQILEAGRRSPSSQNWQPWDFILVTDRQQLSDLARVWRGAGHVAGSAATIVVIGPAADNEFHRAEFDLGQATMAMTLAAADLGSAAATRASPTCNSPATCSAFPATATGPCLYHSATRVTGRSRRSRTRSGGLSLRSCTAAAGKSPEPLAAPVYIRSGAGDCGNHLSRVRPAARSRRDHVAQ